MQGNVQSFKYCQQHRYPKKEGLLCRSLHTYALAPCKLFHTNSDVEMKDIKHLDTFLTLLKPMSNNQHNLKSITCLLIKINHEY